MKPGEQFTCPHCGKNAFLKKESVMDGWKKAGEVLKCVSCSAVIEEIRPPSPAQEHHESGAGLSKLADILGAKPEDKPKITATASEKRFCRDCAHLVAHPFLCRCALLNRDVNPMDDCPKFKPKSGK